MIFARSMIRFFQPYRALPRVLPAFLSILLLFPAAPGRAGQARTVPERYREPVTGMAFVPLPAGCFLMGTGPAPGRSDPDEQPVHEVCVGRFWMGRCEVTNAQYRRFRPDHASGTFRNRTLDGPRQPVVRVSWEAANRFARWLTAGSDGRRRFRLPTEAEWEYACRAGTSTSRFWGEDLSRACRYANVYDAAGSKAFGFPWPHHPCDDGRPATAPVGRFAPNPFGLADMLGNVWEWCVDVYSPGAYRRHRRVDPVFSGPGVSRVARGGGWSDEPVHVRATHRDGYWAAFEGPYLGFRLVMTVPEGGSSP